MKDLSVSLLLDFYGNLLPEKQLYMMEQYYQEDLSLSEIAIESGITRQGVHDNIRRAAAELKEYEHKLGLTERFADITESANRIREIVNTLSGIDEESYRKISSLLNKIIDEA